MSQKYIAQWAWGHNELWMDMRRYHYTDIDPVSGTQVFRGFTPPTVLYPDNGGKIVQRIRPRYNSEYVWNRPGLDAIGGLALDYHTEANVDHSTVTGIMKRHSFIAALLCAAAVSACGDEALTSIIEPPSSDSRIRFFHFGVLAPGVNFYANDTEDVGDRHHRRAAARYRFLKPARPPVPSPPLDSRIQQCQPAEPTR